MVISLITTTFKHVSMISLTFKVLFVKFFSLMLCLGLSVPGDVPRCSASTLALLASFINSGMPHSLKHCVYITVSIKTIF